MNHVLVIKGVRLGIGGMCGWMSGTNKLAQINQPRPDHFHLVARYVASLAKLRNIQCG